MQNPLDKRCWMEVDLDLLRGNIEAIRAYVGPGPMLMGVIKANGYNHGVAAIASEMERCGVQWLAVASLAEGAEVRQRTDVQLPILVLGVTSPAQAAALAHYNLTQALVDEAYARQLSDQAVAAGVQVAAHIKLDTGMGRLGFPLQAHPDRLDRQLLGLFDLPGLRIGGAFTHFAAADEASAGAVEYTRQQIGLFDRACRMLQQAGHPLLRHCCNSAGTVAYPEGWMDMVRPGSLYYGYNPTEGREQALPLVPIASLKTVVAQLKTLPAGLRVSYGCTYETTGPTRVATLPIGYADGVARSLSNRGRVLIRGQWARVIGRVCMDQMMVDVTGIDGVAVGDVVTVVGREGAKSIDFFDLAQEDRGNYLGMMTGVGRRVAVYYYRQGRCVGMMDPMGVWRPAACGQVEQASL